MTAGSGRNAYLGLGLLSVALGVPALLACDVEKPRKVRVSVVVILACEKDLAVDKKLECIAKEARKTYPKLTGFKLVNLACKSMTVGTADKFDLVEDQRICITVQRAADKMDRVRLKIGPPQMGEITYSTPCGKFLPVLTPLKTAKGESVLIAVRVQPCNGK
jgi:hypothetical protein